MSNATDTDLQQLKDLITAGQLATQQQIAASALDTQKQIAELSVNTQKQIAELSINTQKHINESALNTQKQIADSQLATQQQIADLDKRIAIIDERTKLGFWGFIFRGTALAFLAALTAIFVKYLFPILPPELPKF